MPKTIISEEVSQVSSQKYLTERDQVDLLASQGPSCNLGVLSLEVGSKLGTIVAAVGLGPKTKVPALVVWECCVKVLEERPDVRGGADGRSSFVVSVAKTSPDGLINVEHVGDVVPGVLVQARRAASVDEMAGPVFLEQPDHRRAARSTVQPENQRGGCRLASCCEEPVPHLHIVSLSVVTFEIAKHQNNAKAN